MAFVLYRCVQQLVDFRTGSFDSNDQSFDSSQGNGVSDSETISVLAASQSPQVSVTDRHSSDNNRLMHMHESAKIASRFSDTKGLF